MVFGKFTAGYDRSSSGPWAVSCIKRRAEDDFRRRVLMSTNRVGFIYGCVFLLLLFIGPIRGLNRLYLLLVNVV